MLTDPTPDSGPHTGIRIYVAVSAAVLVAALCYVGWVFWSRAHEDQLIEERVAAQRRAQDEQTVESMGGNRFEILAFYANPPAITPRRFGRSLLQRLEREIGNARTAIEQGLAVVRALRQRIAP